MNNEMYLYYVMEENICKGSFFDYNRAVNLAVKLTNDTPWHTVDIIDTDGDQCWSNVSDGE